MCSIVAISVTSCMSGWTMSPCYHQHGTFVECWWMLCFHVEIPAGSDVNHARREKNKNLCKYWRQRVSFVYIVWLIHGHGAWSSVNQFLCVFGMKNGVDSMASLRYVWRARSVHNITRWQAHFPSVISHVSEKILPSRKMRNSPKLASLYICDHFYLRGKFQTSELPAFIVMPKHSIVCYYWY